MERLAGTSRFGTADVVAEAVWAATGASGDGITVPDGQGHVDGAAPSRDAAAELVVHVDPARSGTAALDGATVAGEVAIELRVAAPALVDAVTFAIDGDDVHRERRVPYDLVGTANGATARLLDTARLGAGDHVVTARVDRVGAPDLEVTATMTVVRSDGSGRHALLALGEHPVASRQWPDAMVGSYLGAATGQPVLLTRPDALPASTAALLDGVTVSVIGGPVAIGEDVVAGLRVDRRLAGTDRYATAVAVVDHLADAGRVDVEQVWGATGTNWPDAITAGPVVAGLGHAMVLIDGSGSGFATATSDWMHRAAATSHEGRVIGGPVAVVDRALTGFGLDLT